MNMSKHAADIKKITAPAFTSMKVKNEKIAILTAYDYTMAALIDKSGVDAILVGDSAANVMAGYSTTLPLTIEQIIYHAASVTRAVKSALVIVDMPFGTCSGNPAHSLDNAVRIMKETGADALKIEGGKELIDDISKIVNAGIPVMGHLGLMPQSIHKYGTFGLRAKDSIEAKKLLQDAKLLESIGCFSITLEKIPSALAKEVTDAISIPTIGIGAGSSVDGQVLVMHDMLELNKDFSPRFVRKYAELYDAIMQAASNYVCDVKSVSFPSQAESY